MVIVRKRNSEVRRAHFLLLFGTISAPDSSPMPVLELATNIYC